MASGELLELFTEIRLPDPEDAVIEQVRTLVREGHLKGGDRLPSERRLEGRLGLTRNVISRAFRRLESYGILRTLPQSGTYLAALSAEALDGLIANVLRLDDAQLEPLTETRAVLEAYAAELAAARVGTTAGEEALEALGESVRRLKEHIALDRVHYDEDMVFHLRLAAASGNPVLKSVLTRLIVSSMELLDLREEGMDRERLLARLGRAAIEHGAVVDALRRGDAPAARQAILTHFEAAGEFLGNP